MPSKKSTVSKKLIREYLFNNSSQIELITVKMTDMKNIV